MPTIRHNDPAMLQNTKSFTFIAVQLTAQSELMALILHKDKRRSSRDNKVLKPEIYSEKSTYNADKGHYIR